MGASGARVRYVGLMPWGGGVGASKYMYYRPDIGSLVPTRFRSLFSK